jgi:hypothetical protein
MSRFVTVRVCDTGGEDLLRVALLKQIDHYNTLHDVLADLPGEIIDRELLRQRARVASTHVVHHSAVLMPPGHTLASNVYYSVALTCAAPFGNYFVQDEQVYNQFASCTLQQRVVQHLWCRPGSRQCIEAAGMQWEHSQGLRCLLIV